MQLFYIANARIPTQKAHGYQITRMCHEYSELGFAVNLVIPEREKMIDKDIFSFYNLPRSFTVQTLNTFDFFRIERILGRLTFFFQATSFFLHVVFLSVPKRSIVITRHPSIAWLAQKKGARVTYECHDWFGKSWWIALKLLRNMDAIVTTNGFIRDQFLRHGISEHTVITAPNGVDLDTYQLDIPKKEAVEELDLPANVKEKMRNSFVALYTGSFTTMNTDKGISTILSALTHLKEDVSFLAVGGNEKDIAHYEKEAARKEVSDQTHFAERVDQSTLAYFQRAADVLLMPFPKKAHYEYFMSPLKTFEYMASGRPIIASALPSIQEILNEQNALFIEPDNPQELAEQITFVKNNPDKAQEYADKARKEVQKYTWQKRAEKISGAIRS